VGGTSERTWERIAAERWLAPMATREPRPGRPAGRRRNR
jgi:hypothetical protein